MLSDKLIQEYKEIFKKEYGQDLTDSEARDQAQRLTSFFEILYDQAIIEHRRKLRLKKDNVRGFYLDSTEGLYTCAVCRENYPGNDIYEGTWQTVLEDGVYKMRKSKILEVDNPGWDWFCE